MYLSVCLFLFLHFCELNVFIIIIVKGKMLPSTLLIELRGRLTKETPRLQLQHV